MGIVTKLEVQKRNKKRVSVYVDETYVFSLSLDEAARLSKGQVLTDDDITALMNQSAVGHAVDRALRFLTLRPRSESEVRQNLARNGVAPPVVEAAIQRITEIGYLDDRVFAKLWVEDRMRFKPTSPKALRYELKQKGVENAVIDSVLAELDAEAAAYHAAESQVRKLRGTSQPEFRERLQAFMLRRGFDYSLARKTIKRLIDEIEADVPDYFADGQSGEDYDEA